MNGMVRLTLDETQALVSEALIANRTAPRNATATAQALVRAEADQQQGHGLARVRSYAAQSLCGKVDGFAQPEIDGRLGAALRIDGKHGFAYPAIDLAIDALSTQAEQSGVAIACIRRSHHFGQAGAHVERLANLGCVGLLFGNTPKAMPFWGGSRPALGTNPIAFAAPISGEDPLVIDLSLSVCARGKVLAASKSKTRIPDTWALDSDGQPTTDPDAALKGSLLPIGGAKGAALAIMVEVMAAAVTGSRFGFEASSVLDSEGEAPDLGHTFIAISPHELSGGTFGERMKMLAQEILQTDGARLPGANRLVHRQRSHEHGLAIEKTLYQEILGLQSGAAVA